jgi:hypothetical protein
MPFAHSATNSRRIPSQKRQYPGPTIWPAREDRLKQAFDRPVHVLGRRDNQHEHQVYELVCENGESRHEPRDDEQQTMVVCCHRPVAVVPPNEDHRFYRHIAVSRRKSVERGWIAGRLRTDQRTTAGRGAARERRASAAPTKISVTRFASVSRIASPRKIDRWMSSHKAGRRSTHAWHCGESSAH